MDKLEFRNNLIQTLHEEYDDFQDIKFIIIPDILESNKFTPLRSQGIPVDS